MEMQQINTDQKLSVQLDIILPRDSVLVKKVALEELQKQSIAGAYWTMKDLEKRINKKHEWIKENILYKPTFKQILDVENGGFVYYPKVQGQTWSFEAIKMAEFLQKNFNKIFTHYK